MDRDNRSPLLADRLDRAWRRGAYRCFVAAAIGAKWKHVRTATLLLRAVLFVAVVEGSAVAGEDGDAETVLDCERADYEDEREPRDVADVDALDADERQ